MKGIFTIILLSIFNVTFSQSKFSIKNDRLDSTDHCFSKYSEMLIDTEAYLIIDDSDIEILKIEVIKNCLNLQLKHRGTQASILRLVDSGDIYESLPPQRLLRIDLIEKNEGDKYIIKDYYFDFSSPNNTDHYQTTIYKIQNKKFRMEY